MTCGQAIVVSSASSSSVRSLATIAVYRCFSSLSDDRSSLLGSRSSSSFIRSFARIATVHCVLLSEDDRSVSCVLRSSIFVVAWGLSLVVRRRLCAVARVSSLVSRRLSSPVLRSFVVARALSLFVRLLTSIVILHCLLSPEVDRSFSLRVFVSCGCMTRVFEICRSECRVFALFFFCDVS